MFSKKYKITKKEDFNKIYKNGSVFYSEYLKVFVLPNNLSHNRFSVVISKKVSTKAVVRNKIKRKITNSLVDFDKNLKPSRDIIIIPLLEIATLKTNLLKEKFEQLLKKI
ncbi:MAG: ribonuclease P protein component [Candidatus Moranbacteria bacterium]|jgi:ribonuclease P protein component|nr:ribonuclease P protein component [Candidatus Moranbacteria bacterium]